MVFITIGTTPTITYKYKTVSPSDFRACILTIKCNGQILIEKTLSDAEISTDSVSWTLTQAETLSLGTRVAKMMCNWVTADGTRGASEITTIRGDTNHIPEVI